MPSVSELCTHGAGRQHVTRRWRLVSQAAERRLRRHTCGLQVLFETSRTYQNANWLVDYCQILLDTLEVEHLPSRVPVLLLPLSRLRTVPLDYVKNYAPESLEHIAYLYRILSTTWVQLPPFIVARSRSSTKFTLLDGHHRLAAARLLCWRFYPAILAPVYAEDVGCVRS